MMTCISSGGDPHMTGVVLTLVALCYVALIFMLDHIAAAGRREKRRISNASTTDRN